MIKLSVFLKNRNKKLQDSLIIHELESLLVTDPNNLFYLSGYENKDAFIIVTRSNAYYFTDMRYFSDARDMVKHLNVVCLDKTFNLASFCGDIDVKKICFESHHMTFERLSRLKDKNSRLEFSEIKSPILDFRHIKDEYEIDQIKKACDISNEVYVLIKSRLSEYQTELEIAWEYESLARERGASGVSFDPIIANGVGSAIPHYSPTKKLLNLNELVLMDLGCKYNGYASDMTRVILPEKVSPEIEKVFNLVEESKEMAIEMIKPGFNAKDVDLTVRKMFKSKGCEGNFTHSLGHSVGIDVHDGLTISKYQDLFLEEGMVITIEPGLYFDKQFGIRNEDIVVVGKTNAEILT